MSLQSRCANSIWRTGAIQIDWDVYRQILASTKPCLRFNLTDSRSVDTDSASQLDNVGTITSNAYAVYPWQEIFSKWITHTKEKIKRQCLRGASLYKKHKTHHCSLYRQNKQLRWSKSNETTHDKI